MGPRSDGYRGGPEHASVVADGRHASATEASPEAHTGEADRVRPSPLVVDLNGTLLKTDSLIELFVVGMLRKPLATLMCLGALIRGRGAFKRKVAEVGALSIAALPLREDFVA